MTKNLTDKLAPPRFLPDSQETYWPSEQDEIDGTADEKLHINPSDKLQASYQSVLDVLHNGAWKTFWWEGYRSEILMDMTTANLLVKVHDALSPESQKKMEQMIAASPENFDKVIKISWKATK